MNKRIVLRTINNLSFAGEIVDTGLRNGEKGVLLKPSLNNELKIWCPLEEISCIIDIKGETKEGDEIIEYIGL